MIAALDQTGNLPLGDIEKHQPDISWLLIILSTLVPKHRFFSKSYRAPPRKTKKTIVKPSLKLPPNFMSELPQVVNLKKVSAKTLNTLLPLQKKKEDFEKQKKKEEKKN